MKRFIVEFKETIMTVAELIELLQKADPTAQVVLNCDGSVFGVDPAETIDQATDYAEMGEFGIISSDDV